MAAVREKGQFRLEGKDYIVQDGEICHFRFNRRQGKPSPSPYSLSPPWALDQGPGC